MIARRALLALPFAAVAAQAGAQPPLTVLAAASLKDVLDAQGAAFRSAAGAAVRFSYAASSVLARQIEAGAPADIFISADIAWMDYLAQRRLIRTSTRRELASARLALIAARSSRLNLPVRRGMPLAQALGQGRLAVAAPDVPAGRYARAALEALGVLPSVANRLAPADSVRSALVFVARGEAPLGIVYDTDAAADPRVRIVGLLPAGSHPPVIYPGAVLARSRHPHAERFMGFLRTPQGAAIFRRHGFAPA